MLLCSRQMLFIVAVVFVSKLRIYKFLCNQTSYQLDYLGYGCKVEPRLKLSRKDSLIKQVCESTTF